MTASPRPSPCSDGCTTHARPAELATFPLPDPPPSVVVGANGPDLAALAGRCADGVNVDWDHPRRDELFATALDARDRREGFVLTAWRVWSPDALDHARYVGIDRVVLVVPASVSADDLAAHPI